MAVGGAIERRRLASGLRLVTERMPEARSLSLGVWAGVGARDEPAELAGVSHFLEHLLFKGTPTRSARQIAEAVEAVGGEMNAYTAKEYTAYYLRLPAEELESGLALLADVVSAPALRPHEVEAERQVILEELLMDEDSPEDRVHALVFEGLFPGHPLGRETAGTADTVEAVTRDDIAGFFTRHYGQGSLVVAAAGRFEHDQVASLVGEHLPGLASGHVPPRAAPAVPPTPLVVLRRPTEQAHLALGFRGVARDDPDRYALDVANHVLGGGMSSRLFQEVREERGLAYSVYSSASSYADTGAVVVYAGTAPGRFAGVARLIVGEVERLVADGVTPAERDVAVGFLTGSMVLGLEDSGSRMARLAASETTRGRVVTVDEQLAAYRAVTVDDVRGVLGRVLGGPRTVAVVGPFEADAVAAALG